MSTPLIVALVSMILGQTPHEAREPTPFVRALWLVQHYGTPDAVNPRNDIHTKAALAKALGKDGVMKADKVAGLMTSETFRELAGADGTLDAREMGLAIENAASESRKQLYPKLAAHLDYLATSFDLIDEPHRDAGEKLAGWIAEHLQRGKSLEIVVICTGNTRRSVFGATMGNAAAAYCGMPEIRFSSGGTAPAAVNPRTVVALKEIGVEIEPTGKEAKRGEPKTANPIYRVRWGQSSGSGRALETVEFSKLYTDDANPHDGFAALMVCSEADASCPLVRGASTRLSMPYVDPKIFDDSPYEALKYRERRDDMGRLMLSVMLQARARIASRRSSDSAGNNAP
jgi:hypothetical protein